MRDIIAILMVLTFVVRSVSVYSQNILMEPDNHSRFFPQSPSKNQIDVKYYSLQVYIDTQNKSIAGICEIHFIISTQSKNVNFDFTNQIKINKILDKDGNIINFSHKNDKIIITGKDFNSLDSLNYLAIYYNGTPKEASEPPWDGGFIWEEKVPFVGITCQLEGASIWWPCNDRWDDKPDSMSINVIVPDSLIAISNGVLRGIDKYSPTETIYNWFVQYPIQTYNVTLYVGDFYNFSYLYFSQNDTLKLDFYVKRVNLEKAKSHFFQIHSVMEAYEYYFGKYPFYNSGFKMIEVPYIGMEHQSAIAYGNNFKNGYRGLDFSGIGLEYDYIILHEIAHEWWGNSVSAESKNDMWINESLATYGETLLVEYVRGYEDAMVYLNHDLYYILRNNNPICDTVNGSIYGTDMYNKGSALWNTFRHIVNDDNKWMCFLRTLHDNYKYKTLSTKEILIYINEYFQEDYNYIFDQYVFSPDIPVLELFMDDISKDSVLSYRWTNCVDEFRMPIRIDTENGSINITPISFIPTRNEYLISKTDFEKARWKYLFNILFTYEN